MNASDILDRFSGLHALRANYEPDWADIARLMRPIGKGFNSYQTEGQRRHTRVYDSSPIMALEHFKAGMYASMTPQGSMWFELQHVDAELNEWGPVKDYLKIVNTRTWKSFGPGISAFYNQITAVYGDLGAFGTGALFSAEAGPGQQRLIDRARALHEIWIDVNEFDEVDTLFRKYELTAKQLAQMAENAGWSVPAKVMTDARTSPTSKHYVIHAIYPSPEKRSGPYAKRFAECFVLENDRHKMFEGGFVEFPYMVPRWDVAAGERYGRGCGHTALADVKSLNLARKSNLTLMDRAARPPILAMKETDYGGGIAPSPGEVLYGAMNADGRKLVAPMDEGKSVGISLEMEAMIRKAVQDAFYFGLMETLNEREMTLGEYMGRNEERQRLLGPYLGRIETELLSPLVKRRVGILERAGQLPPMPKELAMYPGGLEVRYVSPLAKLQRRDAADSVTRAMAALAGAAQIMPDVVSEVDPRMVAEMITDGLGASGMLRTREVAQNIRDMQEQQQRLAAMAELAPGVAKGYRDMNEGQRVARENMNAAQ